MKTPVFDNFINKALDDEGTIYRYDGRRFIILLGDIPIIYEEII
ncbi:Uncharacterised protein [uncultured archaeon]|nr:Uncharacterised protein [uncultured archaeon]